MVLKIVFSECIQMMSTDIEIFFFLLIAKGIKTCSLVSLR